MLKSPIPELAFGKTHFTTIELSISFTALNDPDLWNYKLTLVHV